MGKKIIGRKEELAALKSYIDSDKSEFIAVYGRRRVGKTFLIRAAANDAFAFFVTGMHGVSKEEQLINFSLALQRHSRSESPEIQKNWIIAFASLAKYLDAQPDGKKIIFMDELPWMDTPKSGFVAALENFWNSWAALRDDVKLIVCGSATSWMISKLIRSRGGLHNRLTHHLAVEPFTLAECEEYYREYGFRYSRKQIAESYMIMGGIPYYMSMMDNAKSLAQNIDALFFAKNAQLRDEYRDLYHALFRNASPHIAVVTALASKGKGMTRKELVTKAGVSNNGALSLVLEELISCGFIRDYLPFGSAASNGARRASPNTLYQLTDFYTLFYFKFVKGNKYMDESFWTHSLNSPSHNAWAGLSFEMLCLSHLAQIKKALGISGVQTMACSWRSSSSSSNAQIDLLIDRRDDTVNLCEMKFSKEPFEIDKAYENKLTQRLDQFMTETHTKKALILTMITSFGVKDNAHSEIVQSRLTLEDLFAQA